MSNPFLYITTEKRSHDWIAYLTANRKTWDAGKTEVEAIGRLIISLATYGLVKLDRSTN